MRADITKKLEQFFSQYPRLEYEKNQTFIKPLDNSSFIYYLKEGYVRQYFLTHEGEEITIHIYRQQAYFPMILALNTIPNRYYFEAASKVVLFKAPSEKVIDFIKINPDIHLELTRRLSLGLTGLLTRIENLLFDPVEVKLASLLLYLANHFGQSDKKNIKINLSLTHKDFATWIGTSRETVSRQMKSFEKSNLIFYTEKHVVIKNRRGLEKLTYKLDEESHPKVIVEDTHL